MKKIGFILSLFLMTTAAVAENDLVEMAYHEVALTGLHFGEGRYILGKEYVNNQFRRGGYFCAGADDLIYGNSYEGRPSQQSFHEEHVIKFSICQDATLANCQEFAIDKFTTFRNAAGYLQNDTDYASVDVAAFKDAFQPCIPDATMDAKVRKARHLSDRRFAHVG